MKITRRLPIHSIEADTMGVSGTVVLSNEGIIKPVEEGEMRVEFEATMSWIFSFISEATRDGRQPKVTVTVEIPESA